MKKSIFVFIVFVLSAAVSSRVTAQAGLTVSPGKLYYKLLSGGSATQKIIVSNPTEKELEIGVSMSDWNYDSLGNNQTFEAGALENSCADWVQVLPGSFFTLKPQEKRELSVVFSVPADANKDFPVHTAMLFLTQLNPGDGRAANGTAIKVSVRMGVKLYHSFSQADERDIEIVDMKDVADTANKINYLELALKNTGKTWLEGKIKWELLNTQTGDKRKLDDQDIFSLPGDYRIIRQLLPADLAKGKYTATAVINYGNKDQLKLVELEFTR